MGLSKMKNNLRVVAMLASLLGLMGCNSPVTTLEVVVTAASAAVVAVPLMESAGLISTETGTVVVNYAEAINTAATKALAEENSADTPAQKATKIVADFSGIAIPALGPTVGPEVAALIQAISAAVQAFLIQFQDAKFQVAMKDGKYVVPVGDSSRINSTAARTTKAVVLCRSTHPVK
jgi:hypothetical protein